MSAADVNRMTYEAGAKLKKAMTRPRVTRETTIA